MYLIQITIYKYGIWKVYTDRPKAVILEYVKKLQKAKENTYICIHATNAETGETRIMWNNKDNQLFNVATTVHSGTRDAHYM